jgi:hypothetical protein
LKESDWFHHEACDNPWNEASAVHGRLLIAGSQRHHPRDPQGSFKLSGDSPIIHGGKFSANVYVLQPDITAPGVSVIAAWTRSNSPTDLAFDLRRVAFNSESGTSMSCPHVSGIVGLLRTLHPEWSPAAIKSAIMTTGKAPPTLPTPLPAANERSCLQLSD